LSDTLNKGFKIELSAIVRHLLNKTILSCTAAFPFCLFLQCWFFTVCSEIAALTLQESGVVQKDSTYPSGKAKIFPKIYIIQ